jgi:uncharacterized repeat protein (TIGR01451 family)/fimbrial isopeptide formation D2 family protein
MPGLMNTFIHRQATALKNFLLKALVPVQGAHPAARDALLSGGASRIGNDSARRGFGRAHPAARARGRSFGGQLLFVLALSFGAVSSAQAVGCNADYGGVIDGNMMAIPSPFQIDIDGNCTFRNIQNLRLNAQFPNQSAYLVIFDNVTFNQATNFTCNTNNDGNHVVWVVNSTPPSFGNDCRGWVVPVEAIAKQTPAGQTSATIGVPFTYTLTLPVMKDPYTGITYDYASVHDLYNATITDNLNRIATGADLSYVSHQVYWSNDLAKTPVAHGFDNTGNLLTFKIPDAPTPPPVALGIPAGQQLVIEITVVLDNTAANRAGAAADAQFTNTAEWDFYKYIDFDGPLNPLEPVLFPLPGEPGRATLLAIGKPELEVTKTGPATLGATLNIGDYGYYGIQVKNAGSSDAWNVTVLDVLPKVADNPPLVGGMCEYQPEDLTTTGLPNDIRIVDGNGVTLRTLAPADYTLTWVGDPTCELKLILKDSAGPIGAGESLMLEYKTKLDQDTENGAEVTNIAVATQWFNDMSGNNNPTTQTYTCPLPHDGTVGTLDCQDAHTVLALLSGYLFEKTVHDPLTDAPVTSAQPGDRLRYKLSLRSIDEALNGVTIVDNLASEFLPGSLALISCSAGADCTLTPDGAASVNVSIPSVVAGSTFEIVFDVQLKPDLDSGIAVDNQSELWDNGVIIRLSDDPNINGPASPTVDGDDDPTIVTTYYTPPLPPTKSLFSPAIAEATIGQDVVYQITVPSTAIARPLHDVVVTDTLDVNLQYVGATATLYQGANNLGNLVLADNTVGQDVSLAITQIPAGHHAVIELQARVRNELTAQQGIDISNAASYTYRNIVSGAIQPALTSGTVWLNIVEPYIDIVTKAPSTPVPTSGEIVRYSVTLTAGSGTDHSDVFDVTITDSLGLGLAYEGNPSVTLGTGVGSDNTIADPTVTGNGVDTAQQLVWSLADGNADIDIAEGETVTIEYDVRVLNSVLANTTLTNSVEAQWTSIDGALPYMANPDERNGTNGIAGLNDYITTPVTATVTTSDMVATITKERTRDTFGPADADVRIGDIVEYTLSLSVPEGTLGDLVLIDTLPQGLIFEGIASINGSTGPTYTAAPPFAHADITAAKVAVSGDPAAGPSTVTWSLGSVTNLPDDGISNNFVIVYRARVLNNDVLAQAMGTALNNTVDMSYMTTNGPVTASDIDTAITVRQPILVVTKSSNPVSGSIIAAGDIVTYTVEIQNTGDAPAYDVVLRDVIPGGMRVGNVTTQNIYLASNPLAAPGLAVAPTTYSAGVATWNFDTSAYMIPANDTLVVVYSVLADADIAAGLTLTNQATVDLYYSFDDQDAPLLGGIAGQREEYGPTNTGSTTLYTGAPPVKTVASSVATIGQDVVYTITVPGTAGTSTLYDVAITDQLDANLEFVSVNVTGVAPVNVTDNSTTNLDISISEIPFGQQAVITLTARVRNEPGADQGVAIDNTASYTYAYTPVGTTQPAQASGIVTIDIVEPAVTAALKTVSNVTLGKLADAPAAGGDILEYVVTIPNSGDSIAHDANVVDTLPAGVTFVTGSATAQLNGAAAAPLAPAVAGNTLTWGRDSGDGTLDIGVNQSLVLTYRVNVVDASGADLVNTAWIDWTSLDGVPVELNRERTGAGCGVTPIADPNNYCVGPVTATASTADTNAILKTITSDTWDTALSNSGDKIARVGDVITYQLELTLREGLTRNVSVSDVLDPGLAFVEVVTINGAAAPFGPVAPFSHAPIAAPSVVGNTVTWTLGDITNAVNNNTGDDTFVIIYRARVQHGAADAPSVTPTETALNNQATLGYTYADGVTPVPLDTTRMQGSESLTVRQPQITAITKTGVVVGPAATGNGTLATPYVVDVLANTMAFSLQTCNVGRAPAYGVVITDQLASELNEASVSIPVVSITGFVGTPDYTYVAPATRPGLMQFTLNTPLDPGACATITYNVGFHNDIAPTQTWSNEAIVGQYWSLPSADPLLAREYIAIAPVPASMVWMTNAFTAETPIKTVVTPSTGEITIGEDVTYEITVPGAPVNAALADVKVSDTLDPSIEYVISAVEVNGVATGILPVENGQVLEWTIPTIPAGQQAVITLTARVVNSADTTAGDTFANSVSYTYDDNGSPAAGGTSNPATATLTIVEPAVTAALKTVSNVTLGKLADAPAAGGDILEYVVTIPNSGDSIAHDANVVDTLPAGVTFVTGSATAQLNGAAAAPLAPAVAGNTLTWGRDSGDGTLDIGVNQSLVLTYRVNVVDASGADLVNTAWIDWTSLDGVPVELNRERTGAGCGVTPIADPNNYCVGPVTATASTADTNAILKTITSDTWDTALSNSGDKIARVGDVITYQLELTLREGLTRNVSVSDVLDPGLAFVEVVTINGAAAPFGPVAPFSHAPIAAPSVVGNTVTWTLGDITNAVNNNTGDDTFVIIYRARVQHGAADAPSVTPTETALNNQATLGYTYADGVTPVPLDTTRMQGSESLTVRQPQITAITKTGVVVGPAATGNGTLATPYVVDVLANTMAFSLQTCNVGRAPAYGVVITDQLASELNEASVSIPVVSITGFVGTPDYTYVAPATRPGLMQFTLNTPLDPGACATITYNVGFHNDIAPTQTWSNEAIVGQYWSLPSADPLLAREYIAIAPVPASMVWMTNAFTAEPPTKTIFAPASAEASIGQDVTYEITVPGAPVNAALADVKVSDTLDARLQYQGYTWVSGPAVAADNSVGQNLSFNIAQIPAGEQVVIRVAARVVNSTASNAPDSIDNFVTYDYQGSVAPVTSLNAATVTLVEPVVMMLKAVENVTSGKALTAPAAGGDILEYTLTLTNSGSSIARDINVTDLLPAELALVAGSAKAAIDGGAAITLSTPATVVPNTVIWGRASGDDLDLAVGSELVLTYRVSVQEITAASIANNAWVDWTSLDGAYPIDAALNPAPGRERSGEGCGLQPIVAPNDYCYGAATATILTLDTSAIAKAVTADTWDAAPSTSVDATARVGDIITYQLTLTLREGLTRNVSVSDVLDPGLAFVDVVSINGATAAPYTDGGVFTYVDIPASSVPAADATGPLTWTLGDITNLVDNDTTNDTLVIVYRARVLNNDVLAQLPTSQSLDNQATLGYTLGGVALATQPSAASITVQQPELTLSKSVVTAINADTVVAAGETVTYTVDIFNGGLAPAYDTVLVDTLPEGLRQGGVTTTSITLVGSGDSLPILPPSYDAGTGIATWNFDSGVADQYTIPAGETLRVVYQVTADGGLADAVTLINSAVATLYYSFDNNDEPNGDADQREVYGPTNTAQAILTSPAAPLLKQNTQSTAAVGSQFSYRITVPAIPVTIPLHDVRILDDLSASAADLRFVSVAKVSGSGSWTPVNTSGSDTNLVIADTVNGIDIPAGEQVVVEITVELLNTPTNVVGLSFTNTADYTYNQVANTPASQATGRPGTTAPMQIIGLSAQKAVTFNDANGDTVLTPGEELTYTITINNSGVVPVTGVVLADDVPVNTTYVANSVTLNGTSVADGGTQPLAVGLAINSAGMGSGTIAAGSSAVVTFKVQVNPDVPVGTVPAGTIISNQGYVTSTGLPVEPTDADGDATNGYQPTTIVVGSTQQVMITKEVFVVGGGAALPGSQLEYVVRVTNTGVAGVTNLVITDNLALLAGQATYVAGSATLDGAAAGVGYASSVLTADYAGTYGNLLPNATTILRFRVLVANPLPTGTRITNTARMAWNAPTLTADASASIDIGGLPGTAILSGQVWHDANFDNLYDVVEQNLAGWTVGLYRNNVQVASVVTAADGIYSFSGVEPTLTVAGQYELRFTAPGAGANTAKLGLADSVFTNAMQRISAIEATSGSNLQNLNLPIDPNGVVFDSITRAPIAGATLTMVRAGSTTALPGTCFDDSAQQNQVTLASGFYKFSLNYGDASCPIGGDYVINVTPPPTGYVAGPSKVIPPVTSDATAAYDVASCAGDAVADPAGYCEAQVSAYAPAAAVPSSQINHYLHLTLSNPEPTHSQLFNNSIAIDPPLDSAVTISKRSALVNASRGQLVPYTITVKNALGLDELSIVDTFPPGFKYVAGSARVNGLAVEPVMTTRNLTWTNLRLDSNEQTIKLLFIVGSGVSEGDYVNRAQVFHSRLGSVSAEATATVRVVPDPNFDCTDVIGKVFDDVNRNGYQDAGEKGLPGVRVVSARGLLITSDDHGRFHVTCAVVPDENRGSNFILKVDDRTLPTGYRITTENPRVQRATRGKMMKFNFGAAINKIVRLDIANGVFEPDTTEMRMQWKTRMDLLLGELKKAPSILRLAYMAEVEDEKLVEARLKAMKQEIEGLWAQQAGAYELVIETEVFWRLGAPPSRSKLK